MPNLTIRVSKVRGSLYSLVALFARDTNERLADHGSRAAWAHLVTWRKAVTQSILHSPDGTARQFPL